MSLGRVLYEKGINLKNNLILFSYKIATRLCTDLGEGRNTPHPTPQTLNPKPLILNPGLRGMTMRSRVRRSRPTLCAGTGALQLGLPYRQHRLTCRHYRPVFRQGSANGGALHSRLPARRYRLSFCLESSRHSAGALQPGLPFRRHRLPCRHYRPPLRQGSACGGASHSRLPARCPSLPSRQQTARSGTRV